MKESEIPKQECPYCGYKQDATSSVFSNAVPRPGDVSICLNCSEAAVFGKDLIQRLPTKEEEESINKNLQVLHAQMAISLVDKPDLRKRKPHQN